MASNSISNSTSYSAAGAKGMSGLVSGLDTESMVEKMLSGTQNKIDKANGSKQSLIWKQESYRSVITQLLGFQSKFFDFGGNQKTNMLSKTFYNTMKASTLSKAIKVSATTNASAGNVQIDEILQLATTRKEESVNRVSGGLVGVLDADKITEEGASFDITLEGTTKTIKLEKGLTTDEMAQSIQDQIDTGFGRGQIKVDFTDTPNGKLMQFRPQSNGTEDIGRKVTVSAFKGQAGEATYLTDGQSNKLNMNSLIANAGFATKLVGSEYVFKINGVEIKASADDSVSSVISKINSSEAGVRVTYSAESDKFSIESTSSGGGRDITFEQSSGNLLSAMFGLSSSGKVVTNTVNQTKTQLKGGSMTDAEVVDLFKNGGKFSFKINGEEKEITVTAKADFDLDADGNPLDADALKKKIDGAVYDLSTSFKTLTDNSKTGISRGADGGFVFETGGMDISLGGGDAADLSKVMRVDGLYSKFSVNSTVRGQNMTDAELNKLFTDGGKLTFSVNGVMKEIDIPANADFGKSADPKVNKKELDDAMKALSDSFKAQTGDESAAVTRGAGGALEFVTSGVDSVVFGGGAGDTLSATIGVDGKASTSGSKLSDFGYSGKISGVEIAADDTLRSYADKLQAKLRADNPSATIGVSVGDDGKISISSDSQITIGDGSDDPGLMQKLFGTSLPITLNGGGAGDANVVEAGQNAAIIVDGVRTERSSNTFELNGLSVEILEVSDKPITITTTKDTDQILTGVKSFIEDYNAMIDKLNTLIHEDPEYREYPPLTDAQKKDMSEKEIEKWEAKSKEGLLRNDDIISSLLSNMRTAMYGKPGDGKIALYDLGIQTSDKMEDYGKLVIEDEAKLKLMIETNASEIEKLFTAEEGGIASTINNLIDGAAKKSSASPGSLVSLAGMSKTASESENILSRQMKDYDEKLKTLKSQYETQKARYWKEFSAMEQMISRMNQQSTWLTSQFQ